MNENILALIKNKLSLMKRCLRQSDIATIRTTSGGGEKPTFVKVGNEIVKKEEFETNINLILKLSTTITDLNQIDSIIESICELHDAYAAMYKTIYALYLDTLDKNEENTAASSVSIMPDSVVTGLNVSHAALITLKQYRYNVEFNSKYEVLELDLINKYDKLEEQHKTKITQLEEQHHSQINSLEEQHKTKITQLEEQHRDQMTQSEEQHKTQIDQLEKQHAQSYETLKNEYYKNINELK